MRQMVSPLFILFIFLNLVSPGQEKFQKNEYSFMFYNSENFFDCEDDSMTIDDDFTPEGDMRWNPGRMHDKAERLAKVILAAGKWNPPIFVGLCEIENLNVLELLTNLTPLNKFNYKIVHKESPDERGIDVAFIYRPELFHPFHYQTIPVIDPSDTSFKTRDILKVSGILNGCDTIHIFVNHWPSRYGGMMETVRYRRLAAETLKLAVQNLKAKQVNSKIICTGDFNDTPNDDSLVKVFGAQTSNNPEVSGEMINLSAVWMTKSINTLKNQYTWEVFDQWIVSDYFLESQGCFEFSTAEIFDAGFLLEPDTKFGGMKPKRTYVGYKYQEGFSDHLPVLIRLKLMNR
jgi:hypothetical protein